MNEVLEYGSLLESLLALKDDEKIFVIFDTNIAKQMRFLNFQKDALQNIILSYINATNELANEINFNKFVEKVAKLTLDEQDITERILHSNLPEEVASYLASPAAKHMYTIDSKNSVIILSHIDSSNGPLHSCERHSPGQEHVHNESCAIQEHTPGHAGHSHSHDHNH